MSPIPYSSARSLLQSGDVILFRGNRFWSSLIRLRTASVFTHTGIVARLAAGNTDRVFLLESKERRGVQIVPLSAIVQQHGTVDWFALSEQHTLYGGARGTTRTINRDAVVGYALSRVGKRYASVWQFLRSWGLLSRRLADRLGCPDDTDPERQFCSEFVLNALLEGGLPNYGGLIPARTSPGELATEFPQFLIHRGRLVA